LTDIILILQVLQRQCWMHWALTSQRLSANHSVLKSRSKAALFQPLLGSMYATFSFVNVSVVEMY